MVRFARVSGRRLTDETATALIRTEEGVKNPEVIAEKYKTDLIKFITSGKLYDKLASYGIFPGLVSVELAPCCEDARYP